MVRVLSYLLDAFRIRKSTGVCGTNARLALVVGDAFHPVSLVALADSVGAVVACAVIVLQANSSREPSMLHTGPIDACLGFVLALIVFTTLSALVSFVVAHVGHAHVIVFVALLTEVEFALASVVVKVAKLLHLVAVGGSFTTVEGAVGLLRNTLIAKVLLVRVARTHLRLTLHIVVAGLTVCQLWHAHIVSVSGNVLVTNVFAKLFVVITAHVVESVSHLYDGALLIVFAVVWTGT